MKEYVTYIPSPDVREHLEKTGYVPTPNEAASVVWLTDKLSLAEKHEIYRDLLMKTPGLGQRLDLESLIAWEKEAANRFRREDETAPFEATHWHWLETFQTMDEVAFWMAREKIGQCVVGRSNLPGDAGIRARIGCGGAVTRIESDSAPREIRRIQEKLGGKNLRLPVPFQPGDTLYLYGYEDDWAFLERTPLVLLETDPESGQAICVAHYAGFPVEIQTVPYVFLRSFREGEDRLTNSLSCISRYLRGAISLGELLTVYPSLFQLDTSDVWLRDGTYYGLHEEKQGKEEL